MFDVIAISAQCAYTICNQVVLGYKQTLDCYQVTFSYFLHLTGGIILFCFVVFK